MLKYPALLACIVFFVFLLRKESGRPNRPSYALWLPWIWFAIHTTRSLSSWLGYGTAEVSSDYYLEGSPFDRNVFLALIIMGAIVVWKRRDRWEGVLRKNKAIVAYILYLGISATWSEFAFVSAKRWIKEIGHIIMVLIVLSEDSPYEAVVSLIMRSAYLLIPLSWVLNRYFPELARMYSTGGGEPQFTGVTTNKNSLGVLCMTSGIVFYWSFLNEWVRKRANGINKGLIIYVIFFALIAWLLYSARSATAWAGTLLGCFMVSIFSSQHVRNRPVLINYYAAAFVVGLIIIQLSFSWTSVASSTLSRDETLTGRTEFWKELLSIGTNPLIGTGYESFWLGRRIEYFWEKFWWHPNQAHNGYLELYLNVGLVGLALLSVLVVASLQKIRNGIRLMGSYDYQVLRIAFVVVVLVVNMTEAYFKGPLWFIFLLMAMEPPDSRTPSGTLIGSD